MRILIVAGRHPFPPRRGDELRALQCAESLAGRHQVTLLVPDSPVAGTIPLDLPFRVETFPRRRTALPAALLSVVSAGLPIQNAFFSYPALGRRIAELRGDADLVILQLVRLAGEMSALGDTPLIADLVDSLSLGFRSRARRDRRWLRPLLDAEARRVERCEERLLDRASGGLVVSDRDRADLASRLPSVLGKRLRTVPIAVDALGRSGGVRRDDTVVFSGNFGYFVNRDALGWFLAEVWPGLCRARPGVRLLCVGSRVPEALRRELARAGGKLSVDPEDLRAVLARATVAVAPLQCGSGLPIKVLEAWSAGTPVVASPWGAAGVDGAGALEVAATPGEWIEALAGLLGSPERRAILAAAGRSRLSSRYSREAVRRGFLESVESVRGSRGDGARAAAVGAAAL
ncbi:MAG TPA: glycosyltransferase family 4 protein [Thermoanaerobaculia bacterium]|nr:glycosyltransferase family 4 protein [Thermoanaerobaculia bacterium]